MKQIKNENNLNFKSGIIILTILIIGILMVSCMHRTPNNNAKTENKISSRTQIIKILCTPSNVTGIFDRDVAISKDGKYYQLTYIDVTTAIDVSTGRKSEIRRPMLDVPTSYYDKNGNLVGSCGGLMAQSDDSFCTKTLPALSFEKDNICLRK